MLLVRHGLPALLEVGRWRVQSPPPSTSCCFCTLLFKILYLPIGIYNGLGRKEKLEHAQQLLEKEGMDIFCFFLYIFCFWMQVTEKTGDTRKPGRIREKVKLKHKQK